MNIQDCPLSTFGLKVVVWTGLLSLRQVKIYLL